MFLVFHPDTNPFPAGRCLVKRLFKGVKCYVWNQCGSQLYGGCGPVIG